MNYYITTEAVQWYQGWRMLINHVKQFPLCQKDLCNDALIAQMEYLCAVVTRQ